MRRTQRVINPLIVSLRFLFAVHLPPTAKILSGCGISRSFAEEKCP